MVTGSELGPDLGARGVVARVVDPEMPMLTLDDLGVVRSVDERDDRVVVTITPTYSGCPAMDQIEQDIVAVLEAAGHRATVRTTFTPAWTTDWMSDEARRKLVEFGIAGPESELGIVEEILCPNCSASSPRLVSEFSSTACKRMLVCTNCREPFDQFKAI